MNPRAALTVDRFSADDLVLPVSTSYDPMVFDLDAYGPLIDAVVQGREYSREAIRTVLRYLCSGRYASTAELAKESFDASAGLQRRYGTVDRLLELLPFPGMLACSLDLATGTGKSFVEYILARIMLNEGLVDRVLVLCPSRTIEDGLLAKFNALTADAELTDLLPERPAGYPVPTVVDATTAVKEGEICIENIHAAYEHTGSSIDDSFSGQGGRTLVLSDEAHHIHAPQGKEMKRWKEFLLNPTFGFRYHVGLSGTCYAGNDYFSDVVYRYAIRDAMNDRWVKEVFYLAEDDSGSDYERFQKLLERHEKNRSTYKPHKPLTISVTKSIKDAKQLGADLVEFLATRLPGGTAEAEERVLVVSSAPEHEANVLKLQAVDGHTSPVEWIVSVSMLSEGWDVKNVFQIYPHEKRAFNSKLLISQVLGRGLRRPAGLAGDPVVYVFNHQKWGPEVADLVAEVLDQETTVTQRPTDERPAAAHFDIHQLVHTTLPTGIPAQNLGKPRDIKKLKLLPQGEASEDTTFVSAVDATRTEVMTTKVAERYTPLEEVVTTVRKNILGLGDTELANAYGKQRIRKVIQENFARLGESGDHISQENRATILRAFGSLAQKKSRSGAILQSTPSGLGAISTRSMHPVKARVSGLTSHLGLFYDELSAQLGVPDDALALKKAQDIEVATNLREVENSFNFKSPVNLVLTSHKPEYEFVRRLLRPENAKTLRAWVKAPDTGFYGIEFSYQRDGVGRSKHGVFNPDFFLLLEDSNDVIVVETKGDADDSAINAGKVEHALKHFETVNDLLEHAGESRRYQFHMVSPKDYDRFFEKLRAGDAASFTSGLQAAVSA
jgi:type III restriction enzyme